MHSSIYKVLYQKQFLVIGLLQLLLNIVNSSDVYVHPSISPSLTPRMLQNLDGRLTELSASDFYRIFFHFAFLWYSNFVINSPRFFNSLSGQWKSSCIGIPKKKKNQIWLYKKINSWEAFLLNYKYFSCQTNSLLLLLKVCKNHYK